MVKLTGSAGRVESLAASRMGKGTMGLGRCTSADLSSRPKATTSTLFTTTSYHYELIPSDYQMSHYVSEARHTEPTTR
jgi:hypothetical protein